MTLPKAIEVGQDILRFVKPGDPPDEHDALKLLIEAGKRILRQRKLTIPVNQPPLPGENIV